MKKNGKCLFGVLLSLCFVQSTMIPAFATQAIATWPNASYALENKRVTDEIEVEVDIESELLEELPDNDELLTGYFEQQLYDIPSGGISAFGNFGEAQLTGLDKIVYDKLKAEIIKIAEGNRSNTEIVVTAGELDIVGKSWTASELNVGSVFVAGNVSQEAKDALGKKIAVSHSDILDLLLVNCPYELYWFDKTKDMEEIGDTYTLTGLDYEEDTKDTVGFDLKEDDAVYTYKFTVAEDYQTKTGTVIDDCTVNSAKVSDASSAAANAKNIVNKYKNERDILKLKGYLSEICALTSYNDDAAQSISSGIANAVSFGDPWQVIYVFDGDTTTSVVCEGYAKAFQYLCDLTDFDNSITSYIVTGTMTGVSGGQTSSGPHMWNVITMEDGKNYLVDVTNCDAGTIGSPDKLFIATTSGNVESGYTFTFDNSNSIAYNYYIGSNNESREIYGDSILTLSDVAYKPAFAIVEPSGDIEYGDTFLLDTKGGADGVVTWLSSNESIATVDAYGQVSVNGIGTVVITATEAGSDGYDGASDQYTFTAQKKTLSVSDIRIADKEYDGTINASLIDDHPIIIKGIVGSDDVNLQVSEVQFADRNVGTDKQVNVIAELTGTNADRYTIGNLTASADIFPAELTPVMAYSQTKTYDGTASGMVQEITFDGLKGNDILVIGTDYSAEMAFEDANAGYEKHAVVSVAMKRTTAAGNYQLTENTLDVQGNIAPAPLMIKADNASMEAGAARPNYTATVNGLVAGETISGIGFGDSAGDAKTKGTYTIRPINVTISSGNGNYEINYSPGTLTITLPTELIDDAIVKARETKNGVIVSDLAASQISKGTKFANTSEMDALDQAIATAETVIVNAVKLEDIQAAVIALEKQIEVFKGAIKVGTKKSSSGGGGGGGGGGSSSGSSKKPAQTAVAGVLVDTSSNKSGVWTNDAVGRWFRYSDGTWPAGKWLELSQNGQKHWYYFKPSGYLATGWILDGGIWYYLNPAADAAQGQMSVGWQLINGVWYYLNPVSGQRPLGAMYCNEWTPDGYFVDASGAWR